MATLQLQLVGVTAERDHALQQLLQWQARCAAKEAELRAELQQWQARCAAKEAEHQQELVQWQNTVAGLEALVRHLQAEQRSSNGSTADAELPAAPGAAQMAAAEAGPAAAEAPQLAEGVDGEGQGAGAAAAGSDGEGAGAAADELSIPLSSIALGKLGWAAHAGSVCMLCACPGLDACPAA